MIDTATGFGSPGTLPGEPEVQWRAFLRALAEEIDELAGPAERDDMLRGVGVRLARSAPLPGAATLDALELDINEVLAASGWGQVRLVMRAGDVRLTITHSGLPRIGPVGNPPGTWLAPVLEGLYETWLSQLPGAVPGLVARREYTTSPETVTLKYGRV